MLNQLKDYIEEEIVGCRYLMALETEKDNLKFFDGYFSALSNILKKIKDNANEQS